MANEELIEKIESLPPKYKKEVEDFVDFLKSKSSKKGHRTFGLLKGKIKISADFDEPLEEFKDYM